MGIKDTWAVKQLVMATQRLQASRLYERYADSDFFLIHTPRLDEPVVAVIMGYGGETYGLNLFLGATAQASYEALSRARGNTQGHMAMMRSHMLGYAMVDPPDLSFDARKWLKQAKVKPDRSRLYPDPMYIEPGKVPVAALKDKQTHLLLHLIGGILAASEDKAFRPCGQDRRGRVLAVTLTKDMEAPQATIGWEQAESSAAASSPASVLPAAGLLFHDADQAQVPFDLSGVESNGDHWLLSMMPAPGYIEGEDRQPFMLLVYSERTKQVWPCLVMGTRGQAVVDQLARLMRGDPDMPSDLYDMGLTPPPPGLPEQLLISSTALHRVLAPAFSPLGVECHDCEDDPAIQAVFDPFENAFDDHIHDDTDAMLLEQLGDQPPADDDIDGWKSVDAYIKDLIHRGFEDNPKYRGARALTRYFGPGADALQLMAKYYQMMAIDSYAFWFATSYRSTRKQPTLAEAWLADAETPGPVKGQLQAIVDQGPSIYRIGEVDDASGKIEYQDIFTGDLTIVTDFVLSTCLDPGMILPGRLVPAGDFHFFYAAGPLMTGWHLNAALDYFSEERVAPSPKTFREQPHLLGRLWDVIDQAQ